jgi:hypothetical protein
MGQLVMPLVLSRYVHALDSVRVARGAVLHLTCPILSLRLALCGSHSRPHASHRWRSHLRLRLGAGYPFRLRRLPRLPDNLHPFPPVSPELGFLPRRLIDFRSFRAGATMAAAFPAVPRLPSLGPRGCSTGAAV